MSKHINVFVVLLVGIVSFAQNLHAEKPSACSLSDPQQCYSLFVEYLESMDPLFYLGFGEDSSTSLESFEYLSGSIESGSIDIEVFVKELENLKSKDYELFNEVSNKVVQADLTDDLISGYKHLHETKRAFSFTEYLHLLILADNLRLGSQCLKEENIYNTILGNCFINKEILDYGRNRFLPDDSALTVEEVSEMLVSELTKLSQEHEMIEQMLRVIAIYIKKNPETRIDLMQHDQLVASKMAGVYMLDEDKLIGVMLTGMNTFKRFGGHKDWLETFVHENTHQLMQILYGNNANPYKENDSERKRIYREKIMQMIDAQHRYARYIHRDYKTVSIDLAGGIWKSDQRYYIDHAYDLLDISSYDKSHHDREYIVRLLQILSSQEACGADKDSKADQDAVAEILNPLTEYWNMYIKPDIEVYLKENSEYDNLQCSREGYFSGTGR